jgi:hypothetical protein
LQAGYECLSYFIISFIFASLIHPLSFLLLMTALREAVLRAVPACVAKRDLIIRCFKETGKEPFNPKIVLDRLPDVFPPLKTQERRPVLLMDVASISNAMPTFNQAKHVREIQQKTRTVVVGEVAAGFEEDLKEADLSPEEAAVFRGVMAKTLARVSSIQVFYFGFFFVVMCLNSHLQYCKKAHAHTPVAVPAPDTLPIKPPATVGVNEPLMPNNSLQQPNQLSPLRDQSPLLPSLVITPNPPSPPYTSFPHNLPHFVVTTSPTLALAEAANAGKTVEVTSAAAAAAAEAAAKAEVQTPANVALAAEAAAACVDALAVAKNVLRTAQNVAAAATAASAAAAALQSVTPGEVTYPGLAAASSAAAAMLKEAEVEEKAGREGKRGKGQKGGCRRGRSGEGKGKGGGRRGRGKGGRERGGGERERDS